MTIKQELKERCEIAEKCFPPGDFKTCVVSLHKDLISEIGRLEKELLRIQSSFSACEHIRLRQENERLRLICDPETELEALGMIENERQQARTEAAKETLNIGEGEPQIIENDDFHRGVRAYKSAIRNHFNIKEEV